MKSEVRMREMVAERWRAIHLKFLAVSASNCNS
jgi:hypothetical protein